jgi:putative tryptophan/tyrosine transport system substrate-binding protein
MLRVARGSGMQSNQLRRCDFIRLLGVAAAWPSAARAQQPERMRRIGVLMNTAADEPESQARLAAFMQGLQQAGWGAGGNLRIDYRWSPGDQARLRKDAAELVALRPEVILAGVGATTLALQQATRTTPIVMVQGIDPVGSGFVESLARPGGDTTGFIQFEYSLAGKWMELLKEVTPEPRAWGCCENPAHPPLRSGNGR